MYTRDLALVCWWFAASVHDMLHACVLSFFLLEGYRYTIIHLFFRFFFVFLLLGFPFGYETYIHSFFLCFFCSTTTTAPRLYDEGML